MLQSNVQSRAHQIRTGGSDGLQEGSMGSVGLRGLRFQYIFPALYFVQCIHSFRELLGPEANTSVAQVYGGL